MHPILFTFYGITVHTYGFFLALAVLAAIFIAKREAVRLGVDPDKIVDACFYVVVAAIVGSRLFYVATNPEAFISAPLEIFKIWNGGLVFYGGFIGAVAVVLVFFKIHHLPLGKCADIAAVALPLGHFLGRMGCFFAGCCYGKTCDLPWAITFRDPDSLAPLNIPLHPTQIYESGANLMVFLLLFAFRKSKKYDGQLFWVYMAMYGINRTIIETFRADFRGATFFHLLSISQTIGLCFAAAAVVMLIILGRRHSAS
ncbi:MAG: prolipoprotein diacylglyceryl transferase [Desulfobacteraceae bacterium]|nr:MAG: prolipoprotein diacylglyceryl transferase [Desulfobacteraceae bacterium]